MTDTPAVLALLDVHDLPGISCSRSVIAERRP